ncbi:MAG: CDP-alcohol phosphatidyltransferase family protein, partial [Saprospiraceae bacterium]|nr:CDP-alcohol phosphatidyltransferase family protein [Saprospiraceae bacterium]
MNQVKQSLQQVAYNLMNPFIKVLIKMGITPNMITFLGFILNVLSTVVLIYGAEYGARNNHKYIAYAGIIILLG